MPETISNLIIRGLQDEYQYAISMFPPFRSAHEGYAIILEEVEELKREVFKRKRIYPHLRREALQVATMAIRFISDIFDDRLDLKND